jgi:SulP family sulfate permease
MNQRTQPYTGLARFVPGIAIFKGFEAAMLRSELVAAVTVFAILVPSAMAYGELAGVTPVAGLYVALGAMLMYALFGTSRQLILGPEATTAILTAAAVAPLAGGDPVRYAALAAALAILVGLLSIFAGIVRLGFITDLLSKPILVGYIAGSTLIVIASQSGKLFGISLENRDFFPQLWELITRLHETHWPTLLLGLVCMAGMVMLRRFNRALPSALIVVVAAILVSVVFNLAARGIAVVGPVPAGLPSLTIPRIGWLDLLALLPTAFALCILIFADEILTARVFAAKHNQTILSNQEFIAIGTANLATGLLQGFPAATSSSRTVVNDQMGGKTQLVGLLAVGLTGIFLLFLTPLLAPLPTVALAAIIIVSAASLIDVQSFMVLRRIRRGEFWLAVVTLLGVLTVGVLQGILVAVTLSLVSVLYRIARPHDAVLDDVNEAGGAVYREVAAGETPLAEPGLLVYRFDAPLVFANAAYFTARMEELIAEARSGLRCVILDAEAISDFDSTAADAVVTLDGNLDRAGVELWLARPSEPLVQLLEVTGLTTRIGAGHVYPSVRAAVLAYRNLSAAPAQLQPAPSLADGPALLEG